MESEPQSQSLVKWVLRDPVYRLLKIILTLAMLFRTGARKRRMAVHLGGACEGDTSTTGLRKAVTSSEESRSRQEAQKIARTIS